MPVKRDFGLGLNRLDGAQKERLISYINLKLASLGLPYYRKAGTAIVDLASDMLENFREKDVMLADYLPPVDQRIQDFIAQLFEGLGLQTIPRLPSRTLVLDRYGMGRELSIPPERHEYTSPTLKSYRILNGILHNPNNDRRTTEGVFHVVEHGLPIPLDKKAVPVLAFSRLLAAALNPPPELLELPFTADEGHKARTFLSLYLRPLVRPSVPGWCNSRSMELRFFVPGSLAATLDFIESIFGNSGDPYIAENDASLDPMRWTGTSGCIILATHLVTLKKRDLGLPAWEDATDRQKRDGMAWKDADELYNDGKPFKVCARSAHGHIVSIIADNYFGYSKKEVKSHISYSANLVGLAEEEHAGGALVFPSYNLGTLFVPDNNLRSRRHSYSQVLTLMEGKVDAKPEGYAVDIEYPNIVYLREDASISLDDQQAHWRLGGVEQTLRILPDHFYIHPTGYRIHMERHPGSGAWRLIGTTAEGLLCHKPCTVSGGGKSEISKSLVDAVTYSPLIIGDFREDMEWLTRIIEKDYSARFRASEGDTSHKDSRALLSMQRSLGSVIKLLSPSPLYNDEYNAWLKTIPERLKALVFLVKRFYDPHWGKDWASHFSVDEVNGALGNILKYQGRAVLGTYLRVGKDEKGRRRVFKLRQDFMPAEKVQWEDDISASITVPASHLESLPGWVDMDLSVKFSRNVEARFFQRPDDAIVRGYDKQAESDLARKDNFISNFEPLPRDQARSMQEQSIMLSEYSAPMRGTIENAATTPEFEYFVASDHPRIVDGQPSKNPRYLQLDPSYVYPIKRYLADLGSRLYRRIPATKPILQPVGAILPGRRNNPADHAAKIRPLAVYGPIHYQDLPELFMDLVCSLTGKSPSTTGAGSEGALTKGPFNCLVPTTDLNNALLSFVLTGHGGFSSAAGHIGHKYKVDHDVSLLMPELWSRMSQEERNPEFLKRHGYLEKIADFKYKGRAIAASRLGWRINILFASHFLGRIFDTPTAVFPDDMLAPELQSIDEYVDGIDNILEAQKKSALVFLEDGSDCSAIPPLKAILHIMASGEFEGKKIEDPEIRRLFTYEYITGSDWYRERLATYREQELEFVSLSIRRLRTYLAEKAETFSPAMEKAKLELEHTESRLGLLRSDKYLDLLVGSIGLDPLCRKTQAFVG